MKKVLIISAAMLLALTTLATQASAGPRYKVQPVHGSSFGFYLGSPGFGFNYGFRAGHRHGWGPRGYNRPWKRWRRNYWRGAYRPWGWYGPGPRGRYYSPRSYQYQEHHHYYGNNPVPRQPAPQGYIAPQVPQDAPAMYMNNRRR